MPALRTSCLLLAVALAALASGCASTTPKYVRAPSLAPPEPDPQDSRNAYLELIERMQQQGAWYASLAHVEAFRQRYGDRPALRLLQADALRETGQADAAVTLYRELSSGPQAAA
ncbi:Flp pilus assembly protein TadD, partial [Stenotrophomonas maltophilia]